jgi:ABC-type transport system involved in multi-copper enzyme maturation permease subunit
MMPTVKSEFRKLLTVRSTHIITTLVAVLIIFISFYVNGWRLSTFDLHDPNYLANSITGALNITVFGAIVAILLMTHEYRYNTVIYTLTNNNSRSKVLVAKFITVSVYALFLAALIGVLSPTLSYLGAQAHGHTFVPQTLHFGDLAWRGLFYGWGYGMAGLLLATLLRNQVATIVALFLLPDLIDQLLSLLLRQNTVYLPFASLNAVIGNTDSRFGSVSPGKAAGVYCLYLALGWVIAWVLFLRRDAN